MNEKQKVLKKSYEKPEIKKKVLQKKQHNRSYSSEPSTKDKSVAPQLEREQQKRDTQEAEISSRGFQKCKSFSLNLCSHNNFKNSKNLSNLNKCEENKNITNPYTRNVHVEDKAERRRDENINKTNTSNTTIKKNTVSSIQETNLMRNYARKENGSKIKTVENENMTKPNLQLKKQASSFYEKTSPNVETEEDMYKHEQNQKNEQKKTYEHETQHEQDEEVFESNKIQKVEESVTEEEEEEKEEEEIRNNLSQIGDATHPFQKMDFNNVYEQNKNYVNVTTSKKMDESYFTNRKKCYQNRNEDIMDISDDPPNGFKKQSNILPYDVTSSHRHSNEQEDNQFNRHEKSHERRYVSTNEQYMTDARRKNDRYDENSGGTYAEVKTSRSLNTENTSREYRHIQESKNYEEHKKNRTEEVSGGYRNCDNKKNSYIEEMQIQTEAEEPRDDVDGYRYSYDLEPSDQTRKKRNYDDEINIEYEEENKHTEGKDIYHKNRVTRKNESNYACTKEHEELKALPHFEKEQRNNSFICNYDQEENESEASELRDKQKMVKDIMEHIHSNADEDEYLYKCGKNKKKSLDTFINDTCKESYDQDTYDEEMLYQGDKMQREYFKEEKTTNIEREGNKDSIAEVIIKTDYGYKHEHENEKEENTVEESNGEIDNGAPADLNKKDESYIVNDAYDISYINEEHAIDKEEEEEEEEDDEETRENNEIDVGMEQEESFISQHDYEKDNYGEADSCEKENEEAYEKDAVIKELMEEAKKLQEESKEYNKEIQINYKLLNSAGSTNLYDEIQNKYKKRIAGEHFYSPNKELIHLDTQYLVHLKGEEQALWEENNKLINSSVPMNNKEMALLEEEIRGDNLHNAKSSQDTKNDNKSKNIKVIGKKGALETGMKNGVKTVTKTLTKTGIKTTVKSGTNSKLKTCTINDNNSNRSFNNIPHKNTNLNRATNKTSSSKENVSTGNINRKQTNILNATTVPINKTLGDKAKKEKGEESYSKKNCMASRSPTFCLNKNSYSELKTVKKEFRELHNKKNLENELPPQQRKPYNEFNSSVKTNIVSKQGGKTTTYTNNGIRIGSLLNKSGDNTDTNKNSNTSSFPKINKPKSNKPGVIVPLKSKTAVNIKKNTSENIKERNVNSSTNINSDADPNIHLNKMKDHLKPFVRNVKNVNSTNSESSNISNKVSNKSSSSSISNSASINNPKKRNIHIYKMDASKQKESLVSTENKIRKTDGCKTMGQQKTSAENFPADKLPNTENQQEKDLLMIPNEDIIEKIQPVIKEGTDTNVDNVTMIDENRNTADKVIVNKDSNPATTNVRAKNVNLINVKTSDKWKITNTSNSTVSSNTSQSCRNKNNTNSVQQFKRSNTTITSNVTRKGGLSNFSKGVPTMRNKEETSKRSAAPREINSLRKNGAIANVSSSSNASYTNKLKAQGNKGTTEKIEKKNMPNLLHKKGINNSSNNMNTLKTVVEEEMKKFIRGKKYKVKSSSIPPGGLPKDHAIKKQNKVEHDDLNIDRKVENVNKNCLIKRNSGDANYEGTNKQFNEKKDENIDKQLHEKKTEKNHQYTENLENKEKKGMSYFEWLAQEKKRKEMDEAEGKTGTKTKGSAEDASDDPKKFSRKNKNTCDVADDDDDDDDDDVENVSENLMLEPLSAFNLKQNQKTYKQNDFIVDRQPIGHGRTGLVFKAIIKHENEKVALKVMAKDTIYTLNIERQVLKEIIIQASLKHVNILELIAYFEDKTRLFLILELANGGSIRSKMKLQSEPMKEEEVALYVYQIADALSYLHNFNIIHRDLKPDNILIHYSDEYIDNNIYKYGIIKLADFGFSCQLKNKRQKRSTFCGTVDYMPPEIINQVPYDCNVDLWCLGIVIFELLVGFPPFTDNSQERIFNQIKELKFHFPKTVPLTAQELILKLCSRTAEERISAEEVKSHPWIKQFI